MHVVSLNVSLPRRITWRGESFTTSIFKQPVAGPVHLHGVNFDGDQQADLTVHGGPLKAVYAYPVEHYDLWQRELQRPAMDYGMFGENLTTSGLLEANVHIGDQFRVGTAILMAVQPRVPCFKLAAKFDSEAIIERFLLSGRSGIYFSIVQEGMVQSGDEINLLQPSPGSVTVAEVNRLTSGERANSELLQRAANTTALPTGYRERFASRLARLQV